MVAETAGAAATAAVTGASAPVAAETAGLTVLVTGASTPGTIGATVLVTGVPAAETIGATLRPRRRAPVVGRMAGVKVKGTPLPKARTAGVLLASEGREFTAASVTLAADLARAGEETVQVLSCARLHGVSFGLQTPGLMPTKAEWDVQREIVERAVKKLRKRGLRAEGQVLGTRKPAKRICALADELGARAIVMGADQSRGWLIGGMMWSQEPQAVERRSNVAVHLAIDERPDV